MPVQAFLSHAPLPTRHAHRPTISARPALTPTLAPSKRSLCPSTPQMSLERLRNFIALTAAAGILAFAPADSALAARGGGRVGGSSFRAPAARSYSAPSRSYSAPVQSIGPSYGGGYGGYGGGYYGGGMYMTPLLIGGGGGGLGTLVIAGGAAALAYRVLNERREDFEAARGADPDTAVVSVNICSIGIGAPSSRHIMP